MANTKLNTPVDTETYPKMDGSPNFCKCPMCGSYQYTVGFFTTGNNCHCERCGTYFMFNFNTWR